MDAALRGRALRAEPIALAIGVARTERMGERDASASEQREGAAIAIAIAAPAKGLEHEWKAQASAAGAPLLAGARVPRLSV